MGRMNELTAFEQGRGHPDVAAGLQGAADADDTLASEERQ